MPDSRENEVLLRLIQANLDEILEILRTERRLSGATLSYAESLRCYFTNDQAGLDTQARKLKGTEFEQAAALRADCRRREISDSALECAVEAVKMASGISKAELAFVLARAFDVSEHKAQASAWYLNASKELERVGAFKKALKAFHNHVAMESKQNPARKFLPEFFHIYRSAKKIGENGVAGFALLNISREYELVGSHMQALKFVQRSLAMLETETGSLDYYLAVAHRCHIWFELGRVADAELDLESLRTSEHPEIEATLELLETKFSGKKPIANPKLSSSWKTRLESNSLKLGEMEGKLIRCLSEAPKDKFEVIEFLYGAVMDLEVGENRLKNLILRVRKKIPNLIVFESGKYKLAGEELLPFEGKKKAG